MDADVLTTLEVFESVTQLLESSDFMLSSCVKFERAEVDSLSIRWADNGFPQFNCMAATDPIGNSDRLRSLFKTAANYMQSRQNMGSLWVFDAFLNPQLQAIADDVARSFGLVRTSRAVGLANAVMTPAAAPRDLTFTTIDADTAMHLYSDLMAAAEGMPPRMTCAALERPPFPKNALSLLGLRGGMPVSASTVATINGRLSVLFAATLPTEQGRGFGEATLRKALCTATNRTGISRTLAHVSKALQPFYEDMGYHVAATARRYIFSEIAGSDPSFA